MGQNFVGIKIFHLGNDTYRNLIVLYPPQHPFRPVIWIASVDDTIDVTDATVLKGFIKCGRIYDCVV